MNGQHLATSLDDFLEVEGLLPQPEAVATRRVLERT